MAPQTLAAVATLLSFAPQGNRVELRLDHGSAELVWMTASTFRFRRALEGPLPAVTMPDRPTVAVEIDDSPGVVRLRSPHIEVTLQKSGLLVRVRKLDGTALTADLTEPKASENGVTWERQAPPLSRFFGLGPRTDATLDLAGKAVSTEVPFLVSTAGYGEFHNGSGTHRFDFSGADRYRIEAPIIDYYFYYGPSIKQVFEEHRPFATGSKWTVPVETPGTWVTLRDTLLRLVHGSMSAMLAPSLDLAPYAAAPADLQQRARQAGSLVQDVTLRPLGLSDFRQQLDSFFTVYDYETRDRGFPVWHPLPFQFPDDPECARHADEFLLGDEMLVAPIYDPGGKRSLYLPQGVWTNLETNESIPGRRTITVQSATLPVFARNGVIVPLDSAAGMALHYFPTLAAEFFMLDDGAGWTQVHAAPALDIMRLEIESKKARDYQWVVHHLDRPAEVGFEETKYREVKSLAGIADRTWFYDAKLRNLHVRVRVAAGEDNVISVFFP